MEIRRSAELDTAKGVLITLVVFGHLLEIHSGSYFGLEWLFNFIYFFHMPAFAFLAGITTKVKPHSTRSNAQYFVYLLLILILLSAAYELYHYALFKKVSFYGKNFYPYWHLWFLLSLIFWRVFALAIPNKVLVAVITAIIALAVGLSSHVGYSLSLSRTFYFLPFFVVGCLYDPKSFYQSLTRISPLGSLIVLGCAVILAVSITPIIEPKLLYGSNSYLKLGQGALSGIFVRFLLLVAGAVIGAAFLRSLLLIPNLSIIQKLGAKSFDIFLFHGFIVKLCAAFALSFFLKLDVLILLPVTIGLSGVTALFFTLDGVSSRFSNLFFTVPLKLSFWLLAAVKR